jgi:hypothetical protein
LPLILDKVGSIKDFLNNPIIIYKDYNQIKNANILLQEEIFNYHNEKDAETKTDYINDFNKIYSDKNIYLMTIDNVISDFELDDVKTFDAKEIEHFNGNFEKLNNYITDNINIGKSH